MMTSVTMQPEPIADLRIAALLSRYPNVGSAEVEEMIEFIRSARPVEIARLATIESIGPQFDRFMRDHRDRLRPSPTQSAAIALAILLLMLALWMLS
jgi:hypothetical protein